MQLTVKTRIKAESTFPFLEEMAAEYSTVKRKLFTQIIKRKKNRTELKREFCAQFEITARQFNSIWCEITACISSVYELKLVKIKNLENRIENLEERITKANSSFKIHHFKRKASTLQSSLNKLQKLKSFPSICFGSKKLFKKQFFLEKNGYQSHEEWREEWKAARNSQFFLVGSKDESFGNQSCQMLPGRLQLRLTNKMAKRLGSKTISIPCEFSYSQEVIHAALISGQAMSYRFAKEGSRWYVSLSTEAPTTKLVTDFTQGALGIDLNPSCIALAHISNDGNLVHSWQVPILIQGKSQSQIKATLGQEIAKIVDYAVDHNLPMIIENLDFSKKKTELRSRRMNRMLSHFAYSQFEKMISSRCHKNGVQLRRVNPAYTSVIGLFKFSIGHGLSSHCAAAMTIARRGFPRKLTFSAKNKKTFNQGFSERLRMKAKSALDLPARIGKLRNESRHVWSDWRRLSLMAKKIDEKNYRSSGRQRPERTSGEFISSVISQLEIELLRKVQKSEAVKNTSPPHGNCQEDRLPGVIDCFT